MTDVFDMPIDVVMGGNTNAKLIFFSKHGNIYHATIRYDDKHMCTINYGVTHEFHASGDSLPLGEWKCTVCNKNINN